MLLEPAGGMRDFVPPDAAARRALVSRLLDRFALHGYALVSTPPIERAEVMALGLGSMDRRDLVRFVEPDTGELALLRPDITPQIARVAATRLAKSPLPFRLSYEGTVVRRRRGRARTQWQVHQVGVELVGVEDERADVEMLVLADRACEEAHLDGARVELGDARIVRAALDELPQHLRAAAAEALSRKDGAEIERLLRAAKIKAATITRLTALTTLYGDKGVLARAKRLLDAPAYREALRSLAKVHEALRRAEIRARVGLDLGETRGFDYYTGVFFTVLADGPGEPLGGGGRYDALLARYHLDAPATGFALDVDNVMWALGDRRGALVRQRPRIVCTTKGADGLAEALRARDIEAVALEGWSAARALEFGRAWGYDVVLTKAVALRIRDGARKALRTDEHLSKRFADWALEPGTR